MNTLKSMPKDYISVSQLNAYINCPEKYRRKYVEQETFSNFTKIDGLLLGSAVHRFLEFYYTKLDLDKTPALLNPFYDELINFIEEGKLNVIVDENTKDVFVKYRLFEVDDAALDIELQRILSQEEQERFLTGYDQVLKTKTIRRPSLSQIYKNIVDYFRENNSKIMENIAVESNEENLEYTFNRYGKDFKLNTYLDFLGTNTLTDEKLIIDWKTTKKKWSENDVLKKQDFIYSYIIWKLKNIIPVFRYVVFSYSEATGNVDHQIFEIQYDKYSLQTAEASIHKVCRGINEEVFYKNESSFLCSPDFCEYYKSCQGYKEGVTVKSLTAVEAVAV